ncbi:MAG TPA: hypothetical protein ENN31_00935 [Candidatus Vogelbacteria bacterium]|nr:hypothetical protein [Candidatus Vogelbacteria bacterium]
MLKKTVAIIGICLFLSPVLSFARIGVGVATSKIIVEEELKPGLIYNLPALSVVNTGTVSGEYTAKIEYHQDQENNPEMGLCPKEEWFEFVPNTFSLEPGESQQVKIILSLPVRGVVPGNYFAYLEASPITKGISGQSKVGIAAASRLYFTVVPGNFLSGIYYRLASLMNIYSPWSYSVLTVIVFIILVLLSRRYFSFDIGISVKKK